MIGGIAVAGRAGSGKSTLARHLQAELNERGYQAQIVSFATELKREVWERYGLKKGDVGSREALIEHGERRRAERPNYWVLRLVPVVCDLWNRGIVPLCDDLRRRPEYDWLTECGFYRVRVTAPEAIRRATLAAQGLDPDFALSDDPTETDHERWVFDRREHLEGVRAHRWAAQGIVDRAVTLGVVPPLQEALRLQKKGGPKASLSR